jgi:CHASE2 domain-containing sensor protein
MSATSGRDDARFFVSYSREDRATAEEFCQALTKRSIPYWIDQRDIDPGSKYSGMIADAIDQSAGVIVLLSENSNKSPWVEREVGLAASQGKDLFPVQITEVQALSKELVLQISGRQSVKLIDRPFKTEQLDHLVAALRKTLDRELSESEAPTVPKQVSLSRQVSLFNRLGRFAKRSVFIKVLAFTAACASAWWVDGKVADNDQASVVAQRLFSVAMHYQFLVTMGPRKPQPSHVFLVEINDTSGVSSRNTCQERPFIGDLLRTLAVAAPRVVVIDKYFAMDSCGGATENLAAGAIELCRADAKLVVGRGVSDSALESGTAPYALDPALDFRKAGASCVTEGVVNLYPDFRRVVLRFPDVKPVHDSGQAPPSLALAAALAYRNDLEVAALPATAESRYVSFLTPAQLDKVRRNATEVLCGSPGDWRACGLTELRKDVANLVQGNIVVIGEVDRTDRHQTVLGEMNGYALQANYIESLVDNRLMVPAPEVADWLAGLGVFLCFEYFCARFRRVKLLVATMALLAALWLLTYIAANNFGYYLNPALVAILSILYSSAALFFIGRN